MTSVPGASIGALPGRPARPRPARAGADLPRLAAGGRPPDAHEQPRPGGGRGPGRPRRLRRHRPGRAELGGLRRDRPRAAAPSPTTRRCSSSRASPSASSGPTSGRRGCSSRTRTSSASGRPGRSSASSSGQGLTMYGQMTAGSWIYIGTQGILQGTYETFAELARQHFGGTLRGRVVLTAGLGGMGGAQPLAVTMNEGVCLGDRGRRGAGAAPPRHRLRRPPDRLASTRRSPGRARRPRPGEALSIALVGNAAEIEPELVRARRAVRRRHRPDLGPRRARRLRPGRDRAAPTRCALRRPSPTSTSAASMRVDGRPRPGDARVPGGRLGRLRLRQQPPGAGAGGRRRGRLRLPGLRAGLHPAAVLRGRGPVPLGRRCPATRPTSRATDRAILELFPDDAGLRRWIEMAEAKVPFQGLPARICWLGYGERARAGARVQRARRARARSARRSSSGATTSTRARSRRPTARRRRCATAPTRSPTGRSSTRSSTPPPARPG